LSLQLPSHAAFALFALEELPAGLRMPPNKHKAEKLIRPRARYTGPVPTSDSERL